MRWSKTPAVSDWESPSSVRKLRRRFQLGGDWLGLQVPSLNMVSVGWALQVVAAGVGVTLVGCNDPGCGERGGLVMSLSATVVSEVAPKQRHLVVAWGSGFRHLRARRAQMPRPSTMGLAVHRPPRAGSDGPSALGPGLGKERARWRTSTSIPWRHRRGRADRPRTRGRMLAETMEVRVGPGAARRDRHRLGHLLRMRMLPTAMPYRRPLRGPRNAAGPELRCQGVFSLRGLLGMPRRRSVAPARHCLIHPQCRSASDHRHRWPGPVRIVREASRRRPRHEGRRPAPRRFTPPDRWPSGE